MLDVKYDCFMKPEEIYRRFFVETARYDSPPRFGYDWFLSAIDKIWDAKARVVDWLGLESFTRDCLASPILTDGQKVTLLKEAVAAFTRRGPVGTPEVNHAA